MLVGSRNSSTECASASLLRRVSSRTRSRRFNCNSDGRLVKKIRETIRVNTTPRHVPAKIIDVPAISWHGPSTCLSRIVYNERAKTLLLTFRKSGRQYSYSPVPPELAQDLLNARSKGRFFNFEIKSVYG